MLKPVIIHFREKPERLKMLKTKMEVQKIKKKEKLKHVGNENQI